MLQTLNYYALPFENLNTIAIATCALITIYAIHETLERLIISGNGELSSQTIAGFVLLRSQASLSSMLSIFRLDPIDARGTYHGPNCRCAAGRDTPAGEPCCVFVSDRSPVLVHILFKTSVLRALILFFEVLFLCLALTVDQKTFLPGGRYALTIHGNDFGTHVMKDRKINMEHDCYDLFTETPGRPENFNRYTQAVNCIVKLRPASIPNRNDIVAAEVPPVGFSTFVFDLDITRDIAVINDVNRTFYGAEMYAYWKSKGRIVEGPIPVVGWGQEYSSNRNVNMTSTELIKWRNAMHLQLSSLLGKAYRTAYGANRTLDSQEDDVVRMVMYIDMSALPSQYDKGNATMVFLLNDLVGLQRSNKTSSDIAYADGASIKWEFNVVEYVITGPILGLVPWILLMFTTVLSRGLYSRFRPNKFYGLIFAMFKTFVSAPMHAPFRSLPPGRLIFNEDGILFAQDATDGSLDESPPR